jgi:hypothetical protein
MAKAASKIIEVGSLGLIKDPLGIEAGEQAATQAAQTQTQAGLSAIEASERAAERVREDLSPFREAGVSRLPILQQAIDDPSQRVLNNPFFQALAAEQEQRLMASQSARGKLGSGETDDALTRQLLLLGNQFAQQDIGNIRDLVAMGQNAAAQTGTVTERAGAREAELLTQIGNVQGAGIVGKANVAPAATRDILRLGGTIAGAVI